MSSFTSALIVSPMSDGRRWKLIRPFTYRIGKKYSRRFITVAKNFVTDFASIPRMFFFLPDWATYNKPGPLHDWLYHVKYIMGKPISRKKADDIFYEAMLIDFRHHRSGKIVALTEYYAVRIAGGLAWKKK